MSENINVTKLGPASTDLIRKGSEENMDQNNPLKPLEFKGKVEKRKKSFLERLKETFIADDARDVGDYILWDILIPTLKRTLNDIICGASNRVFLGGAPQSSNLYHDRGVTRVRNTSSMVRGLPQRAETRSLPAKTPRGSFNIDIFESTDYGDVSVLLDNMVDYLEVKKKITVSDYYSLAFGSQAPYTAENWGWYTLRSAEIERNGTGKWCLKLPRPEFLG